MAVYLVEAPSGTRLIEARTQASATNFVMRSEVKCTTLNVSQLVQHIKSGMTVEAAGGVEDPQLDIEVEAAKAEAEEIVLTPTEEKLAA